MELQNYPMDHQSCVIDLASCKWVSLVLPEMKMNVLAYLFFELKFSSSLLYAFKA